MLFLSYLEEELSPDVYTALVAYQLYYFTDTIVQSAIMDEFEEFVYNDPDTADYTTEDYDRIMYEIIAGYGIDDSDTYTFSCMEWLWRNVGISSPVYYLSYGVSAMASLNLYSQSTEDYDAAVEAYQKLQEEVDFERSFIGTLENAGIRSVFDEEAYIALFDIFEEI